MNPPSEQGPESLSTEQDWVRGLVKRLVHDEARAEDVLQATWMRVLRHPPQAERGSPSWRSWFARVAKNLALRDTQRSVARRQREERVARGELLPSTLEIVEREEARRRVVEAVLALPEPYRSTLILRFYEELDPRAIARAQGTNGSTVRNRIARGLVLLRERLEREKGPGWVDACLAVLPFGSAPSLLVHATCASLIAKGGMVMKQFEVVAAAVLVTSTGVTWMCWPEREPSALSGGRQTGGVTLVADESASLAGSANGVAQAKLESSASEADARAAGTSRQPVGVDGSSSATENGLARLFGKVVDQHGQPLGSAGKAAEGVPILSELPLLKFSYKAAKEEALFNAVRAADDRRDEERKRARMVETEIVERRAMKEKLDRAVAADDLGVAERKGVLISVDALRADHLDLSNKLADRIVVDQFAAGLSDVRILLRDSDWNTMNGEPRPDGTYAVEGLHPGHWQAVVTSAGKLSKRQEFEIEPGVHTQRLDFVLDDPLRVRVVLHTPDGRDLERAIADDPELSWRVQLVPVALRPGSAARFLPSTLSAAKNYGCGSYTPHAELGEEQRKELEGVAGVLTLSEAPPLDVGLVLDGALIARHALAAGDAKVEFVLSLDELRRWFSTVTVRVVDAESKRPVAGASVVLEGVSSLLDDASIGMEDTQEEDRARVMLEANLRAEKLRHDASGFPVDARGEARVPWVPAGARNLYVQAPGYANFQGIVDIEAGGSCELPVVSLTGTARIRGRVLDERGKPAAISFSLVPLDRFEETHAALANVSWASDEHGAFEITGQRRERYVLRYQDNQRMLAPLVVDASTGEVVDLELHLVPTIEARFHYSRELKEGAELRVLTAAGLPVLERDLTGFEPANVELAPGNYLVEMREGGKRAGSLRFVVPAGPDSIEMKLPLE